MEPVKGLLIVVIAGIFQGTFILPMTLTRGWNWENIWLIFSVLGMLLLNLILARFLINDLGSVYLNSEIRDLIMLALLGLGWGLGAVLFGIGMDRLGMSLGYPIIMGLIASTGGLLPLFVLNTAYVLKWSGLVMMAGMALVVLGIIFCAKAATLKEGDGTKNSALSLSVTIAVAAGILSALPNVGYAFSQKIVQSAIDSGTSELVAGSSVWALFFSVGVIPNVIYTVILLHKNKSLTFFFTNPIKNLLFGLAMSIIWIFSFHLYGIGSYHLGQLGTVVGWPIFISISIIVGHFWGLLKGEWKGANPKARKNLIIGIWILVSSMFVIGLSDLL